MILSPPGDHVGWKAAPPRASWKTLWSPAPFGLITHRAPLGRFEAVANTILDPSGDHRPAPAARPQGVSWVTPVPSAFIWNRAKLPARWFRRGFSRRNSTRDPSGE